VLTITATTPVANNNRVVSPTRTPASLGRSRSSSSASGRHHPHSHL